MNDPCQPEAPPCEPSLIRGCLNGRVFQCYGKRNSVPNHTICRTNRLDSNSVEKFSDAVLSRDFLDHCSRSRASPIESSPAVKQTAVAELERGGRCSVPGCYPCTTPTGHEVRMANADRRSSALPASQRRPGVRRRRCDRVPPSPAGFDQPRPCRPHKISEPRPLFPNPTQDIHLHSGGRNARQTASWQCISAIPTNGGQ